MTFGDSITDGALSTRNANARWPDVLARRLQSDKKTANLGIINEGIGGNRVLHDVSGPSALARFDRDVLAQSGVKYLIIMESINDIGHATDPDPAKRYDIVTADDLIFGLSQLAERAHTHGIKVFGATLTPYGGANIRLTRQERPCARPSTVLDSHDQAARRQLHRLRQGDAGPRQPHCLPARERLRRPSPP